MIRYLNHYIWYRSLFLSCSWRITNLDSCFMISSDFNYFNAKNLCFQFTLLFLVHGWNWNICTTTSTSFCCLGNILALCLSSGFSLGSCIIKSSSKCSWRFITKWIYYIQLNLISFNLIQLSWKKLKFSCWGQKLHKGWKNRFSYFMRKKFYRLSFSDKNIRNEIW